ncbi:hypothetical protein ACFLSI_01465 [Bacteroidota bacterium]
MINKINKYRPGLLLIILITIINLNSCVKPDDAPRLEITVMNEAEEVVTDAYVSLYENIDEWGMQNNPVQVWKKTNAEGKVTFIGLREIVYYFVIKKDQLDNSGTQVSLDNKLKMNEFVKIAVEIK